jgi:sulfur carrier protein ThiS
MEEKAKKMKYFINGNCKEASNKTTLQSVLIGSDEYKEGSIISLNGIYMNSQKEYENIQISEGDKIEVINLLAGG